MQDDTTLTQLESLPEQCTGLQDYATCEEKLCELVSKYGAWEQLTDAYDADNWFFVLEFSSSIMATLFGTFILFTKELQVHPMKIIMYLAFAESVFQIMLVQSPHICQTRQNELLALTLFGSTSNYNVARATFILASSNNFFALGSLSLSISLNTCLCIDLILMVRYPFTKKENRVPWYLVCSLAFSFIIGIFATSLNERVNEA